MNRFLKQLWAVMHQLYNCGEDPSRTSLRKVSAARRNVRPEIAEALSEVARLRICAGWGAAQSQPRAATPVVSRVPTLILPGQYDPRTPPLYAEIAGRTLRNSRWFEFPGVSHNVHRASPSLDQIITSDSRDAHHPLIPTVRLHADNP